MRVLLTGNTGYITREWITHAFAGYRVLIAGDTSLKSNWEKGLTVISAQDTDYSKLFEAYDFDCVVVFSNRLTFQSEAQGELERLQLVLESCALHTPVRVLYLDGPKMADGEQNAISQAAKGLCMRMASDQLQIQVVQSPHLYSGANREDYFYRMFAALDRGAQFDFREAPGQCANFMAMDDLAELVHRMVEEWPENSSVMVVPDCFGHKFADMEAALKKINAAWRFSYDKQARITVPAEDDRVLRSIYGWFPKYSVLLDLEEMARQYQQAKPGKKPLAERLSAWRASHRRLFMLVELLVAVVLTALCGHLSQWQVQFGLIDFRLLLVVLMGTMYGMNMGLLAAAAASVMLIASYYKVGVNWLILFYEPANWVAFVSYFTVGAVCGYLRLIDKDKIRFAQEENEQLKEKLLFAQNMYHDVLNDKREYKKQIVGSKDSFGKIFNITQQLNVTHEKEVFIQAVGILESIMENHSIALYSVSGGQRYGRLMAASRQIGMALPVSITLDEYKEALGAIEAGEVFTNTKMLDGYPMYAAGIRHNGELCMLVMIREADYAQMSLYYMNLFKILCGLIGSALAHTMEYQEALREKQCVPGTNILTEEHFEKKLELSRTMSEQKIAMYMLLKLDGGEKSVQEMDHLLSSRVRACDTIGYARDGGLYVILAQATRQSLPIIEKRLNDAGVRCQQVNIEEMN